MGWLHNFLEVVGEKMPDGDIHMPFLLKWKHLHQLYYSEVVYAYRLKAFKGLLQKRFPKVSLLLVGAVLTFIPGKLKFPKSQRLGKCTECSHMESARLRIRNEAEDRLVREAMRYHFTYISAERLSFVQRKTNARTYPDNYMSINIDFSEKVSLPHHSPAVKSWMRKNKRFSVTVIGIMDHNSGSYFYHYPTFCYSQDPNLVLSVLFRHLEARVTAHGAPRAKILYLQADNKVAENKSICHLAFATMLIMKGIFSEVYLCYLPPGHTHEDVDQLFSIWKALLKSTSAHLPEDFIDLIDRAFRNEEVRPKIFSVERVWDWKTFFRLHLNGLHFYTEPRFFHFYKNDQGKVVFKAKIGATDGVWSEEMEVLSSEPPEFPQVIQRSAITRECVNETLSCASTGIVSEQQHQDWVDILDMYEQAEEFDGDHSDHWNAMRMPAPPVPIHNENVGQLRLECLPRDPPSNPTLNAYSGLFVAVEADPETSDDSFWIGKIVKVCQAMLKIRWWTKGEDDIWIEDPDYTAVTAIWPQSVIASLRTFEDDGFMLSHRMKANLLAECYLRRNPEIEDF
jgi:hypothetical protein